MILHTLAKYTRSHPLSEVKRLLVRLVLRFVRTWEARMRIVLPREESKSIFCPFFAHFLSLFPLLLLQEKGSVAQAFSNNLAQHPALLQKGKMGST